MSKEDYLKAANEHKRDPQEEKAELRGIYDTLKARFKSYAAEIKKAKAKDDTKRLKELEAGLADDFDERVRVVTELRALGEKVEDEHVPEPTK